MNGRTVRYTITDPQKQTDRKKAERKHRLKERQTGRETDGQKH